MFSIITPDEKTWLNKFHFSSKVRVRFSETDAFGHVNNVSYFIYFEQVRVDYLRELAIDSVLKGDDENFIVTADLYCQYLGETHFGDELTVMARTAKLGNSSVDLEYAILNQKGQLVAIGRGALVFMDRATKRSTPIPSEIRQKIVDFEGLVLA